MQGWIKGRDGGTSGGKGTKVGGGYGEVKCSNYVMLADGEHGGGFCDLRPIQALAKRSSQDGASNMAQW